MSDSEGSKELSGIARSIDALFARSAPDADESSGVEPPPDPPGVAGDALSGAPVLPDMPEAEDDSFAAPEDVSPPPLPDEEDGSDGDVFDPPPEADAIEVEPPPLPMEAEAPLAAEEAEAPLTAEEAEAPFATEEAEAPFATEEAEPPPAADEAASHEEPAVPPAEPARAPIDDREDEGPEPTPLDLAVDAYLAGDGERASEIQTVAQEMLENRELDPIARSVGRIAAAAGDPPDESVLAVAAAISSPFALSRLAQQMGAEHDEDRRREYYLACKNLGEPMAVAIRDDLAESTDRHARRIHCEALVEMGDAGRKMIEEMAHDENRFLARNAVAILGETGGDRAVELVTFALANPDARVRREALRSLAKLGDEESGELVFGLLDDSDRDVRIAAAVTAGELQVERALRPMIKLLDDSDDPDESIALIRALGHLGDPGAVPSIEKHAVRTLFSRPRTDVRIVAYRALHQIGTPHARRLLNQAVDDKEPEVKAAVKEMLGMH